MAVIYSIECSSTGDLVVGMAMMTVVVVVGAIIVLVVMWYVISNVAELEQCAVERWL